MQWLGVKTPVKSSMLEGMQFDFHFFHEPVYRSDDLSDSQTISVAIMGVASRRMVGRVQLPHMPQREAIHSQLSQLWVKILYARPIGSHRISKYTFPINRTHLDVPSAESMQQG